MSDLSLTPELVRRLSGHFRSKRSSYQTWRDALFFDTLVVTRLREFDLLALTTEAVLHPQWAYDYQRVEVWTLMIEQSSAVLFPTPLLKELQEFVTLARSRISRANATDQVFISAVGKPLNLAWVRRLFASAAAKTGIPLQVHSVRLSQANAHFQEVTSFFNPCR